MWHLKFHPTAGYILNLDQGAEPTPPDARTRETLRELAFRVAEIAADPAQREKADLWRRKIGLEPVRPMVLVFLEDSWLEVLPGDVAEISDPFWRQQEWYLRHLIYRHERIDDDFVITPDIYVPLEVRAGDWGLPAAQYRHTQAERGSYHWTPPLQDPADLQRMRPAEIEIDADATHRRADAIREAFGDILPVHVHCGPPSVCLYDIATHLRGIEQCMLDMYDRPEWLCELMDFLAAETLRKARLLADGGWLTLNNRNHYTDSGGLGYTGDLPTDGHDGRTVRLGDCWMHGVAQAASEIGPEMHDRFILEYDARLLDKAGLVAYGCCEPLTHKFDILKRRFPRLRRVSVSPWADVETAAEALADRYVYSWKPNPAMLVGRFDPERIRKYLRRTLDAAAGCRLEIILKDTITLDNEPRRVEKWLAILREEMDG